jgi:hypothetical protein
MGVSEVTARGVRRGAVVSLGLVLTFLPLACAGASPVDPAGVPRTSNDAELGKIFEGLDSGPLDASGTITVDGQRVLDVLAVQGALIRYHAARAAYPQTLDELVPQVMGTVPRDPVTGQPYPYLRTPDGQDYKLSATLSNGRIFPGVAVATG